MKSCWQSLGSFLVPPSNSFATHPPTCTTCYVKRRTSGDEHVKQSTMFYRGSVHPHGHFMWASWIGTLNSLNTDTGTEKKRGVLTKCTTIREMPPNLFDVADGSLNTLNQTIVITMHFKSSFRYQTMEVKVKFTRSGIFLAARKAQLFCIGDANPDRVDWVTLPLFSMGCWRDGTVRTICRREHRGGESCNERATVRVSGKVVEVRCRRGSFTMKR